ncbi:glycosyltransferase family 10 domain-containing protein, partial [Aliivibrio sifiae]|uniref:glycosyltransferase family 10 domain-containing protein n=1 Tax=Aliivibrio sifiae TaxID=566293 RepID=UPI003D0C2397
STQDLYLTSVADFVIYNEMPIDTASIIPDKSYLIMWESEVINSNNWDFSKHCKFKKVFTWHDDLVDNKKYFKINFSHKFPEDKVSYHSRINPFEDKKLCTLISGNKIVMHKHELYSERVKIIRWFEEHAINEFDLYGIGWDRIVTKNKYIRFISKKIPFINKFFAPNFPSYKGIVESKCDTLAKYKFAICYENAQMIEGYITEKIFDCFFAGCVPIYWGAPNIAEHIPENCFIDRRRFDSDDLLYSYLTAMTKQEYLSIQQNIEDYLFSPKANPYRAETFASIIVEHVLNDLKDKHSNV